MLERMFVGHLPGLYDRLLDFSMPLTAIVFYAPSATVLDGLDG
jgi:putative iron-dependent peroxidase